MSKRDIDQMEEQVPEAALKAFRDAFERARKSGHPVVVAEGDQLVTINPDGSRKFLKRIPAKVRLRSPRKATAK